MITRIRLYQGMKHFHIVGLGLFCQVAISTYAEANQSPMLRIGGYIIPAVFTQALEQGMTLPVFLNYSGEANTNYDNKIANAILAVHGGKLAIDQVQLEEHVDGVSLVPKIKKVIEELDSRFFDNNIEIPLLDGTSLSLDVKSFRLNLNVNREAIGTTTVLRSSQLNESTVAAVTSSLQYDLGVFNNYDSQTGSRTNSYLALDNHWGYKEHHLNVNGTLYGSKNTKNKLYRAMYEHDYAGYRFAMGMVDTWNLQSLGNLSALRSQRIYGLSYGNKADSITVNTAISLTPIVVFLPKAGEVHILRDGRLMAIQNFGMGSYEVDTSSFPYGAYDIEVDVVIDGQSVSKTVQRVNKVLNQPVGKLNQLAWQTFGGYLTASEHKNHITDRESKDTYLAGFSLAYSKPTLKSLSVWLTSYAFDRNFVMENGISFSPFESLQVSLQSLLANDRSWRVTSTMSMSLPQNLGSFWLTKEKGSTGDRLSMDETDSLSYGTNINLSRFMPKAGMITLNQTRNNLSNYRSTNISYSTEAYAGRYGSVRVRTGLQHYRHEDSNTTTQKYVSLDFSIPFGKWFKVGVSNQQKSTTLNVNYQRSFEDSFISAIGIDGSKRLNGGNKNNDNISVSGYAMFDNKYTSGTAMVSRPSSKQINSNLTMRGSVGWSGKNIAMSGKNNGNSGIIINTNLTDKGAMSAKIDGQLYELEGKNNYIPLQPYRTYKVELMNTKNSRNSVDIVSNRVSHATLYPGNVAVIKPEVKQMITVFGRVVTDNGKLLDNIHIKNHIGKTKTDQNGDFSIDVDKRYPMIEMVSDDKKWQCQAQLDLRKAEGVYWAGDIVCSESLENFAYN